MRQLSALDKLLGECGHWLQIGPSVSIIPTEMSRIDLTRASSPTGPAKTLAGRLMRVNHAGEMAAQGLYRGHALSARSEVARRHFQQAGQDEARHLHWCKLRLEALESRPSLLDPFWYAASVAMGAAVGWAGGDGASLGFVAETERQVSDHLTDHLTRLPEQDVESRVVLEKMRQEEQMHGSDAAAAGARPLPPFLPGLMKLTARVMTRVSFWL